MVHNAPLEKFGVRIEVNHVQLAVARGYASCVLLLFGVCNVYLAEKTALRSEPDLDVTSVHPVCELVLVRIGERSFDHFLDCSLLKDQQAVARVALANDHARTLDLDLDDDVSKLHKPCSRPVRKDRNSGQEAELFRHHELLLVHVR